MVHWLRQEFDLSEIEPSDVVAHLLESGHAIGVHNDYRKDGETLRLVLHLSRNVSGGVTALFEIEVRIRFADYSSRYTEPPLRSLFRSFPTMLLAKCVTASDLRWFTRSGRADDPRIRRSAGDADRMAPNRRRTLANWAEAEILAPCGLSLGSYGSARMYYRNRSLPRKLALAAAAGSGLVVRFGETANCAGTPCDKQWCFPDEDLQSERGVCPVRSPVVLQCDPGTVTRIVFVGSPAVEEFARTR